MRRIAKIFMIAVFPMCLGLPAKSHAQAHEIAQLLLNVEKLAQFKQILKDMKSGYEVIKNGYGTIKNISQGNFRIHQKYLTELLNVSPVVRNYYRVSQIINYQGEIVKAYQQAFSRFRSSGNFSEQELDYLATVYRRLLKESLRNLDDLYQVLTPGQMRMSDSERIESIDRIYRLMEKNLLFIRSFNTENYRLDAQREREGKEIEFSRKINGLN